MPKYFFLCLYFMFFMIICGPIVGYFLPSLVDGLSEIDERHYDQITHITQSNPDIVDFVKNKLSDDKITGFEFEQIKSQDAKIKLNKSIAR